MNRVGVGTRVINFFLDSLIAGIITFILSKVWNFYVVYWSYPYINTIYIYGGVTLVYYTFFESIWARTPGKWASYSKVVNKKGLKPRFHIIFLRSIARLIIVDCFFIPFLNKTLHDYVSSTEVVEI
ncbi:RDD family protein [Panacibacter sp. DH6]|uniref:RDD family protein n=1 Tax=Panacibacter microcysteis TaxID=2793269 RepID=A0A931E8D0_9BACT|nr:RDD family protein [Panacibacter microcysteis]MBG9376988.1 RDD family protein [Panacibacter microcysteis]